MPTGRSSVPSRTRITLPSAWRVALGEPAESEGATLVDLRTLQRERSLSVAFFDGGPDAFGLVFPIGSAVILLPTYPTLDDVWTLYMLAACERDEALCHERPKSWEAICHYAEQVRQGFVPETIAPERSVQAVLRSISAATLPKGNSKFVDDALYLCELVAAKVAAGAKLLEEDLVGDEPRLQKHLAFLQDDVRVYREDLSRSRRYTCVVPAREGAASRSLPLLVVSRPMSRMFKLWSRRDTASPDGNGYALLLVEDTDGEIVLSSDPARYITVGWLASSLDEVERERGGAGAWYDGARHEGTLVASPREGTKLSLDDVVRVIGSQTRLIPARRVAADRPRWPIAASALALAGAAAVVLWIARTPQAPSAASPATPSPAPAVIASAPAAARPMGSNPVAAEDKFVNLLDSTAGVRTFTHYAIIIGVCSYGSPGEPLPIDRRTNELRHSCNNAWEFAHLLVHDYHYDPKNIVLMLDDPTKVDRPTLNPMPAVTLPPTRNDVTRVIENWSKDHDVRNQKMTLIFYYSGHGFVVTGQDTGLPYLQLANWEADIRAHKPVDVAGFPMDRIAQLVKVGIPAARHVLYLFDNCHAGWALGMGEAEQLELQQRWADSITYGIAASAKDQSAWESGEKKGLSAFTDTLIKGLELRSGSAALADTDDECGTPDHVVTHTELEAYLRAQVPKAARTVTRREDVFQEPVGHRFDGTGQFLFIAPDAESHLARRACAKKN